MSACENAVLSVSESLLCIWFECECLRVPISVSASVSVTESVCPLLCFSIFLCVSECVGFVCVCLCASGYEFAISKYACDCVCLFVCLSVSMSEFVSVCLRANFCVCQHVCECVCLSVPVFVSVCVSLSLCVCVGCLLVCVGVYLM